jgi:hypothetical protein
MRRRPVRKIEIHFIDVAPAPPFRRIIAFDDRVLGHVKMLGRVPIWRLVAAANVPTAAADTQMQPRGAQFQASYPGRLEQLRGSQQHVCNALPCSCLTTRSIAMFHWEHSAGKAGVKLTTVTARPE